jgi:hypothetical protein
LNGTSFLRKAPYISTRCLRSNSATGMREAQQHIWVRRTRERCQPRGFLLGDISLPIQRRRGGPRFAGQPTNSSGVGLRRAYDIHAPSRLRSPSPAERKAAVRRPLYDRIEGWGRVARRSYSRIVRRIVGRSTPMNRVPANYQQEFPLATRSQSARQQASVDCSFGDTRRGRQHCQPPANAFRFDQSYVVLCIHRALVGKIR